MGAAEVKTGMRIQDERRAHRGPSRGGGASRTEGPQVRAEEQVAPKGGWYISQRVCQPGAWMAELSGTVQSAIEQFVNGVHGVLSLSVYEWGHGALSSSVYADDSDELKRVLSTEDEGPELRTDSHNIVGKSEFKYSLSEKSFSSATPLPDVVRRLNLVDSASENHYNLYKDGSVVPCRGEGSFGLAALQTDWGGYVDLVHRTELGNFPRNMVAGLLDMLQNCYGAAGVQGAAWFRCREVVVCETRESKHYGSWRGPNSQKATPSPPGQV